MKDRLRENWPLPALKQLVGSSSTEGTLIPSLESPSACLSPPSTFSVPSPTESEEEEISILEEQAAKNSSTYPSPQLVSFGTKGVSQRGDSVFTFSLGTPLETSSLVSKHIDEENRDLTKPTYTASTAFRFELSPQTLNNPLKTKRDRNSSNYRKGRLGRMVVEREPPKTTKPSPQKGAQPAYGVLRQPEFGKTSPLQNRLQSSVFNVTKPNQLRPEHHREVPDGSSRSKNQFINPFSLQQPVQPKFTVDTEDVVEIPRPANHPTWDIHRSVQPVFSSFAPVTSFSAVNSGSNVGRSIDLTGSFDQFNPDRVFPDSRFGDADPYAYIDSGKATENIKALLEGAFEDEDDKPRTRGRKKKVDAALSGLTTQLQGLNVKIGGERDDQCVDEEEDEEVDDGTVEGLNVKLLPHQVDGVEWMKDKESKVKKKNGILPKGGILADDMGLGKTIQSLSLVLTNPRPPKSSSTENDKKLLPHSVEKCTLVVAPLALIKQWEAEIKNRVSESHRLSVCVHHGPNRTKRFEDLRKYDVVITTYQILVSEHGNSTERADGPQVGCFGLHWYRVILDEAHTIKNRNAKATKACCALRAEYRWCLTGTPMQNNLEELQSLINFLRIKPYNDLSIWKDQITRPMNSGRGGVSIKRLQFYLKAFMKRRTKDVLKKEGALNPGGKVTNNSGLKSGFKITERRIENIAVDFSQEERDFYNHLEKLADKSLARIMGGQKISYASALVLLLRLRQACNHPKLVGGDMAQDQDALTISQSSGNQTPRKSKVVDKELDDMADLLGGLTVETKKCDICQIELEKSKSASGAVRCLGCDKVLQEADKKFTTKSVQSHGGKKHRLSNTKTLETAKSKSKHHRRVIIDSSDEEESGDWVVPESQRPSENFEKAGGSDDENAEGGGDSIGSEDSDTDDESQIESHISHTKASNPDSSEEAVNAPEQTDGEEDDFSEPESEHDKSSLPKSAKIRKLLAILHRESAHHKFIVFSQFTSMLDLIEPFLRQGRLVFTRYDGSMRNDHREASLERLRTDARTRILLCSLKCGSLGLNLTAASRVVILEPFWNPFVEEQAIDRVHRLNQTLDVIVYKLTIAHSVEERILALQEKKRALAEAAIEGKAVGKLSLQDILNLFRRDAESEDHIVTGLGGKTSVLNPVSEGAREGVNVSRTATRASPPVMEKGKAGLKDEGIYGRRWF